MKVLAVDYGRRFLGLALCPGSDFVLPLPALVVSSVAEAKSSILDVCRQHPVETVVFGLPHRRGGRAGKLSPTIRRFALSVKKALPHLRVAFADESLTSFAAGQKLSHLKKGKKRVAENSLAAVLILENYFNSLKLKSEPTEGQG